MCVCVRKQSEPHHHNRIRFACCDFKYRARVRSIICGCVRMIYGECGTKLNRNWKPCSNKTKNSFYSLTNKKKIKKIDIFAFDLYSVCTICTISGFVSVILSYLFNQVTNWNNIIELFDKCVTNNVMYCIS